MEDYRVFCMIFPIEAETSAFGKFNRVQTALIIYIIVKQTQLHRRDAYTWLIFAARLKTMRFCT